MPTALRRLIRVVFVVILTAVVATRLGGLTDEGERLNIGAAQHVRSADDRGLEAVRRTGPATLLATAVGVHLLQPPVIEPDPTGPSDQVGWLTLHESTRIGSDAFVPAWLVALLARLPVLLSVLLGLVVVGRLAEAIAGGFAGVVAEGAWAVHGGLLLHAGRADEPALAATVTALLLAAAADYTTAFGDQGTIPTSSRRRLVLGLGVALGLAAATSFALVPLVGAVAVWVALRRRARRSRGEVPRREWRLRAVVLVLAALVTVWALTGFDVASPVIGAGSHPALRAAASAFGLDGAALGATAESSSIPAPLVARGLLHAIVDATQAGPGSALAAAAAAGGPALALLLLAAIPALIWLRRDRADLPSLLALGVIVPVLTALFAPPRLGATCALAALPASAVVFGTVVARLGRHRRTLAVGLLVGLAAAAVTDRVLRAIERTPTSVATDATPTKRERWMLDRWLRRAPRTNVHLVLGDPPRTVVRVDETIRSWAASDPDLASVGETLGAADVLVVGDWLRDSLPSGALPPGALPSGAVRSGAGPQREPDARLGRLLVFDGASD